MNEQIGDRIKRLRQNKGWSLRELESRSKINYSVLSRIESGKRPLSDSEIILLANLFEVSPNNLLGIASDVSGNEDLSEYQKTVLKWFEEKEHLWFKNKPEDLHDFLERAEIMYETEQRILKRKKDSEGS
ncbi:helix-turn-helix domain-containing protein [Jeotgalibacillus campisalis]|uniref:HTH cro/C1-type domain-containing protein n=1 Tax=Jeotgalibacillus campisalis TaxID=220754 RepID=A0A0C2VB81_9BACL|nr:helix-turn-helix transcriptional regulator [Jeotgalibacillus campisalis]KIL46197.1 hypothetical protein KR50_28720 [Jeotgalibacillus campisalis]